MLPVEEMVTQKDGKLKAKDSIGQDKTGKGSNEQKGLMPRDRQGESQRKSNIVTNQRQIMLFWFLFQVELMKRRACPK